MRMEEHQGRDQPTRSPGGTSEEILGEIREFCRATQTAESTFGRLVVNDGKLVSRLRDGAKITTGTLDKVRAYLTEHRAGLPSERTRSSVLPTAVFRNPTLRSAPPSAHLKEVDRAEEIHALSRRCASSAC